jgi:hypothetical protein
MLPQVLRDMGPKMATYRKKKNALTFSDRYHKEADEYPGHILRVTGDETWFHL